jgi:hypothetical protein
VGHPQIVERKKLRTQYNAFSTVRLADVLALAIILLIFGMSVSTSLAAQKFTVRLLNAKTGMAMGNKKVTVKWVDGFKSLEILVDSKGIGRIELPSATREFFMMEGPRIGNEPDRVAYIDCNEHSMAPIQTAQVLEKGIVPGNRCGHQNVLPRPGEIIFWALPTPWWKPDLQ